MAKISIKYVLPTCIWKYFWRISRYFAFFGEFHGISRVRDRAKYQKPCKNESSKAYLVMLGKNLLQDFEVLYIFHKMWF